MDTTADLGQLEKSAFRKFYGDGAFDIYLGGLLATIPIAGMASDAFESEWQGLAVALGLYAMLAAGYGLIRKYVTRPRLGTFKPSAPRKRKLAVTRIVLSLSVVAGLAVMWLFASGSAPGNPKSWLPLVWLLNCVLVFGAMAYFLDVPRFYVYGLVFGSTVMIDEWVSAISGIDLPILIVFGLPGLGIMLYGASILARFIRDYPVIPVEEASGDSLV